MFILIVLMIIGLFVITAEKAIFAQLVVQKADMPTARYDLASCAVNGIIYVFGGWNGSPLSTVEAYDPGANTWTKKADLPTARVGPSACEINGIIYVIGGWGNSQSLSTVEAYDPATNTWTKKADMPSARQYLTANTFNGTIYAIGGWPILSAVEAYDPATDKWTKKADKPTGRYGLSSSVVNGLIYAIGGAIDGNSGSPTNIFEVYDPSIDRWTKSILPFSIAWSATCVLGNLIYTIDGLGAYRIMVYDPSTDIWKPLTDTYATRWEHTANVVNGKIYVIGGFINGSSPNTPTGSVFEYDPLRAPKRPQMEDTKGKLATLWGSVKIKD
jgi:N-acetylneuraminic acid mutarotase